MSEVLASSQVLSRFLPGGSMFASTGWLLSGVMATLMAVWGVAWKVISHKFKYDQACNDVAALKTDQKKTQASIVHIESSLATLIDMLSANTLVERKSAQAHSPVIYTKHGLKLLSDSLFPVLLKKKKQTFIHLLMQKGVIDEASLDRACWEVMFALNDEEILQNIRTVAYEHGIAEPAFRKLCAIYLREELKNVILSKR